MRNRPRTRGPGVRVVERATDFHVEEIGQHPARLRLESDAL